ncbi:MAG: hypothetical protein P9C48_08725 [Defluviicoccus sp.]|nr:hypothetical protein [Defluviicoccus sp.]MDG4609198.1 hypothetical protein [Defluviicoccus sp.]
MMGVGPACTVQDRNDEDQQETGDALTEEFVRIALAKADHHARTIARRLGRTNADVDDFRHDLLLEVVRRARAYSARRAAWSTFVELVVRNAAAELASRLIEERRVVSRSIDEPIARAQDAALAHGELLPTEAGMAAFWGGIKDPFDAVESRIDIERFVQGLPDPLQRICRLLQTETPMVAQQRSGLSPAEFYRALHELRMRLRAIGLGWGTP